jgi:hypothetical protein
LDGLTHSRPVSASSVWCSCVAGAADQSAIEAALCASRAARYSRLTPSSTTGALESRRAGSLHSSALLRSRCASFSEARSSRHFVPQRNRRAVVPSLLRRQPRLHQHHLSALTRSHRTFRGPLPTVVRCRCRLSHFDPRRRIPSPQSHAPDCCIAQSPASLGRSVGDTSTTSALATYGIAARALASLLGAATEETGRRREASCQRCALTLLRSSSPLTEGRHDH